MPRQMTGSRGWVVAAAAVCAIIMTATTGLTTVITPVAAQGNACVAACKSSHNQCRIATKGSASCDGQLQSCLQGCLKK
jgi:molybdopterin-guanine dinucleotide biosynthesis protein